MLHSVRFMILITMVQSAENEKEFIYMNHIMGKSELNSNQRWNGWEIFKFQIATGHFLCINGNLEVGIRFNDGVNSKFPFNISSLKIFSIKIRFIFQWKVVCSIFILFGWADKHSTIQLLLYPFQTGLNEQKF